MIINILVMLVQIGLVIAFVVYYKALVAKINKVDKTMDKTIGELNDKLDKIPVYKPEKNTYEPEVNEYDIGENRRVPFDDMKYLQVDGAPKQELKIYR
jgi:hypothetical protein